MNAFSSISKTSFLVLLNLCFAFSTSLALAADIIVPLNTVPDINGDVLGTSDNDTITIQSTGSVGRFVNGKGGSNSIFIEAGGTVGGNVIGGEATDNNMITNSGAVSNDLYGSFNTGASSSGGSNSITNSGSASFILGSFNIGPSSSGGSNTITNSGSVSNWLVGSHNNSTSSSGGSNSITNSGSVSYLLGSFNIGPSSSGGSNTITNSGSVSNWLLGSFNIGNSSSGGSNTITNSGTTSFLYGSLNAGAGSSSTGNTILNSGTVSDSIYGSSNTGAGSTGGNDSITNRGMVGGSIFGEDGNDTVTMQNGPENVGGNIDGGTGTDTIVYSGGTWIQNHPRVINFEDFAINATHTLTLSGTWDIGVRTASVNGGILYVPDTLTAGALDVNSGTANIDGIANINGATRVNDTLNINPSGTLNSNSIDISNGGTANIDGSAIINEATSVNGTLNVNTSGTLNSNSIDINNGGTVNIDGATRANSTSNSGTLIVNGRLESSVSNYGYLGGSGRIRGNVSNGGTIAPGNSIGTLSIAGSYSHSGNAVYLAEINAGGRSDLLRINGPAYLNGGTVRTGLPRSLYTDKFSWNILQASGGVNGTFGNIQGQPNSQTLSLGLEYTATNVNLVVNRTSYGVFGSTPNETAVGTAFDQIVPLVKGSGTDMENFLISMDFDFTSAKIQETLNALNPEIYTGFTNAERISINHFTNNMTQRSSQIREAATLDKPNAYKGIGMQVAENVTDKYGGHPSSEPFRRDWQVWGRAFGGITDWQATSQYSGYELSSGGFVLGADAQLFSNIRGGFAMSINQTDLDFDTSASGDQQSIFMGAYAETAVDNIYGDISLSFGLHENDAARQTSVTNYTTAVSPEFDGKSIQLHAGGGYLFRSNSWLFGPTLSLDFTSTTTDGFKEKSGGFLDLSIEESREESVVSSAGFKLTRHLDIGAVSIIPRFELAWLHSFSGDEISMDASFKDHSAASFTVLGPGIATDAISAEAGLMAHFDEQIAAYMEITTNFGDDFSDCLISLGMEWKF